MNSDIEYSSNIIEKAFSDAEKFISNINHYCLNVRGMSGRKNRHFLNNLVRKIGGRYIEIGLHAGSTFCSALSNSTTNGNSVGIDNFSEFCDDRGKLEEEFLDNTERFIDSNFKFYNKDCFKITKEDLEINKYGNFDIYFYDGCHTKEDHKNALIYYYEYLSDNFVFLCDDWNWVDLVQEGTKEAFKELNITIHKEWIKTTPNNMNGDSIGWWNGFYTAICSKENK